MRHMYGRSAMVLAAAMAAGAGGIFPTARAAAPREVVPRRKHDPERLAAAIVKRERKNAKRLREPAQDLCGKAVSNSACVPVYCELPRGHAGGCPECDICKGKGVDPVCYADGTERLCRRCGPY